jgi:hypothetical protein
MIMVALQAIRFVIPVLLFQFVAPVFLPMQEGRDQAIVCYQAVHAKVVSPTFLKEIEEASDRSFGDAKQFVSLLDFSRHFDNLNLVSYLRDWSAWCDHQYRGHAVLYFTLYRILRV